MDFFKKLIPKPKPKPSPAEGVKTAPLDPSLAGPPAIFGGVALGRGDRPVSGDRTHAQ